MDNDAIAALKAAYEASRPGKWEMVKHGAGNLYDIDTPDVDDYTIADSCLEADAAFIVAAHTHVPALLAEVEKLREDNAQLQSQVDEFRKWMSSWTM